MTKLIICGGMIHSGATLHHEIVSVLLGSKRPLQLGLLDASKLNTMPEADGPTLAICQTEGWPEAFSSAFENGRAVGIYSFRDLRDVAALATTRSNLTFDRLWTEGVLHRAIDVCEKWMRAPEIISSKYEIFAHKISREVTRIAEMLQTELTRADLERVVGVLEQSKDRWSDGSAGVYKKILTPEQATRIEIEFREWMLLHGYITSPPAIGKPLFIGGSEVAETYIPHLGWYSHESGDEVARLLREGHFEARDQAFLWLYLRAGDYFVDAGAHVGLYSMIAAKCIGDTGRIVAIEPSRRSLAFFRENTQSFGTVEVIEAALSAEDGDVTLVEMDGGLSSHNFISDGTTDDAKGSPRGAKVVGATLSSLFQKVHLSRVDCLKIDIEGSESEVLGAAIELLRSAAIEVLLIEFSETNLRRYGKTSLQLAAQLQRVGYVLCRFNPSSMQLDRCDVREPIWYDNLVACKDPNRAMARLREASRERVRIARDILSREADTLKIKELEELEGYKSKAAVANAHLEWAQNVERSLSEERKLSSANRTWALQAEEKLRSATERSESNRQWAENTERLLSEERAKLKDAAEYAQQLETKVAALEARSEAYRQWAEKTEELLNAERTSLSSALTTIRTSADTHRNELAALSAEKNLANTRIQQVESRLALKVKTIEDLLIASERMSALMSSDEKAMLGIIEEHRTLCRAIKSYGGRFGAILNATANRSLRKIAVSSSVRFEEIALEALRRRDEFATSGPRLSVVLCTYNPVLSILKQTLGSLAAQSIPPAHWEFILVDNNSKTPVSADIFDVLAPVQCRLLREERPGLSNARRCGFQAARAPVIVCTDDDNILHADYLKHSLSIAAEHPEIGTWGGISEPIFETEPDYRIGDLIEHLAIRNYGSSTITSSKPYWGKWDPIGAGMVVRKSVAQAYCHLLEGTADAAALGRTGGHLLIGGEDTLLNRLANRIGYACSYQPSLILKHLIKKDRVSHRYLRRLLFAQGVTCIRLAGVLGESVEAVPTGADRQWLRERWKLRRQQLGSFAGPIQWRWDLGFLVESRRRLRSA